MPYYSLVKNVQEIKNKVLFSLTFVLVNINKVLFYKEKASNINQF